MSEQSQNIKPKNRLQHLLAKIAGNDTAKAVKPKMKNEFYLNEIAEEGGGGGGGGGANVLTLYGGLKGQMPNVTPWLYKDAERSSEYETYEEAESALNSASIIKVCADTGLVSFPIGSVCDNESVYLEFAMKGLNNSVTYQPGYLYQTPDAPSA